MFLFYFFSVIISATVGLAVDEL